MDVLVVGAVLPFMLCAADDEADDTGRCAPTGPLGETVGFFVVDCDLVVGPVEFFPEAAAA